MKLWTVYVVRSADQAPLYVGVTKDVRSRMAALKSAEWWDEAAAVEAHDVFEDAATQVERCLIAALQPKYNKAGLTTHYTPPTRGQRRWGKRKTAYSTMVEVFRLGLAGAFDEQAA